MLKKNKIHFSRLALAVTACMALGGCSDEVAGGAGQKAWEVCSPDCKDSETCLKGLCVENSLICGNLVCSSEQTCIDGSCKDNDALCGGKECSGDQVCLNDACVNNSDLCNGVLCENHEVCFNNACQDSAKVCNGILCSDDETCWDENCVPSESVCGGVVVCDLSTEECVENTHCEAIDPCRGIECLDGEKCDNGSCRDRRPCEDIVCGDGKTCAITELNPLGTCIDDACAEEVEDSAYKVEKACGENQMCVQGSCMDDGCIVEGEPVVCDEGWKCIKGDCEEIACIGMTCGSGRSCKAGSCYDDECLPLDEHVCEAGKTCAKGDCIFDACVNKEACKQGKVCVEDGSCQFETAPSLILSDNDDPTTDENGKTTSITVGLNNEPAAEVTFSCEVVPVESSDEVVVDCSNVVISADNWKDAQIINISGLPDNMVDGDQTYSVKITSHSTDPEFDGLVVTSNEMTNVDVDQAGIGVIGAENLMTNESGTSVEFSLELTSKPSAPITIVVNSSDVTEGVITSVGGVKGNTITIQPEDWDKPIVVIVTGVDDSEHDPESSYVVSFDVTSADANYNGISIPVVNIINGDNDTPAANFSKTDLVVDEKPSSASFSFNLATAPKADVTVSLSVVKNADEVSLSTQEIVISKNKWSDENIVTVTGVVDHIIDPDEPFEIILTFTSSDSDYNFVKTVTGVNKNVDIAGFVLPAAGSSVVSEDGKTAIEFMVQLASKPTGNVVVAAESSDTTESKVTSGQLTFTSENWNVAQKVTVVGVEDNIVDGDQISTISLRVVESADANFTGLSLDAWKVTTEDNDNAGLIVSKSSVSVNENGGTDTFTVRLSSQPETKDVTVTVVSNNTSALGVLPEKLVFTSKNWNVPQTVTAKGVDNKIADLNGKRDAVIALTSSSEDVIYQKLSANVSATIIDDDTPSIDLSVANALLTTTTLSTTVKVALSMEPASEVVVNLAPTSAVFSLAKTSIKFTPTDWNVPQNVTVTAVPGAAVSAWTYASIKGTASSKNAYNGLSDTVDIKYKAMDSITGNTVETGDVTQCSMSMTLLPGKYKLQAWGASGGDGVNNSQTTGSHGGLGGYAEGVLTLTAKTTVYLHYGTVGYAGVYNKLAENAVGGGCNGGGGGGQYSSLTGTFGYGGGGASDVRIGADTLNARVLVAGGGGGADNSGGTLGGSDDGSGGYGGGESGGYGLLNGKAYTEPGTQDSGFAFGEGESCKYNYDLGGGGGGWYGGFAPPSGNNYGAGGGSGYVLTATSHKPTGYALGSQYYLTNAKTVPGNATFPAVTSGEETGHQGNGYVKITLLE